MLINDHVEQCCLTNSAPQAAACLLTQHQTPQVLPSPQPMRSLTFEEPKDAVPCPAVGDSGVGDGGCVGGDSGGGVVGGFDGIGGGGSCSCGASVPSEAGSSGVEASSLVRCPICAVEMSLAELNAHLDAGDCCPAAAAESAVAEPIIAEEPAAGSAAGSAAESAAGESAAAAAAVAAAVVAAAAAAAVATEAAVAAAAEAAAAAAGRGTARRLRLEQLGKEMRCPICFDLFDRPHSLPCQHSFCYECVMGCFRATSKMECPLCKAPTWRRQVTTNHTLAGIVQAFEALQAQAADSPVRGAERATAASPAASRSSPASTASPTF